MRAKGEGALFQKADGRWCARHKAGGRQKDFVRASRAEAVKARKAWLAGPEAQRWARGAGESSPTVAALVPQYLSTIARPGTRRRYEGALRRHVLGQRYMRRGKGNGAGWVAVEAEAAPLAAMAVADVTRASVVACLGSITRPQEWAQVRHALVGLLRMARDRGLIATVPDMTKITAGKAKAPSRRHRRVKAWTQAQATAFVAATQAHTHGHMWAVALLTGLRPGELYGLGWADVDLDKAQITVASTLDPTTLELGPVKSDDSHRTIDIDAVAVGLLRAQWAITCGGQLVWGGPLQAYPTNRALGVACRRAGVPVLSPHGLRHTHATLLLANGVPIAEVAARLGHASPAVTLAHYAHYLPQAGRAVAALGELFGP